jgi:hypothetical protein
MDACISKPVIFPESLSFIGTGYQKGKSRIRPFAPSASSASILIPSGLKKARLDLYDRLDYFASFDENWNGYGSSPIPGTVLKNAKNLIPHLPDGAKVFPTAQSSIQFELDYISGKYLEIEVFPESYSILFESDSSRDIIDDIAYDEILERIKAYDAT